MRKSLFVLMFMLILFVSEERMVKVTAKTCESKGTEFTCLNDDTCKKSCQKDGFISGTCEGFQRKCNCFKQC
ncbi:putative knottin, scorpion toxin [Helianthus annuus]|uniref:Knottin, scorpion toxin n=1 Tax=Helianthus annuus TaxID=4232 RepID=A0A251URT0_HELAN|nr:putative knottin, scorpion toxin [Helianthus annuus]KAJ0577153.1 putative knottin, scorpion toxin [Helianthus annuus]KAJ0922876.1 putative knottin, scorpion toxin [Helianthus annuus]